jgi:hypothetical protein
MNVEKRERYRAHDIERGGGTERATLACKHTGSTGGTEGRGARAVSVPQAAMPG